MTNEEKISELRRIKTELEKILVRAEKLSAGVVKNQGVNSGILLAETGAEDLIFSLKDTIAEVEFSISELTDG